MHSRRAQRWNVYRNGILAPFLQPLRIEESAGGRRLDYAQLILDPLYQERMEDYTPLNDVGNLIQIEARFGKWKHFGIVTQVLPTITPQGETFKYTSQAIHAMFGNPALGVIMFNPNFPPAPEFGPPFKAQPNNRQFKLVDDPIVFNPEIDGLAVGNMHSAREYGEAKVPVFLDPEAVRTAEGRQLHQGRAISWTLSAAVYYLCQALNPLQVYVRNPSRELLALIFRDSVDFVRNVKIEDGAYLPEALDSLLTPLGYHWRVLRRSGESRYLDFFRRNTGGRLVWLNHQRFGEVFDADKTNVESQGLTFDASRMANTVIGRGSKLQIEITAELVRGWPAEYDATDRDDLKKSMFDEIPEADEQQKNAWRKWVLNESGEYKGTRTEIKGEFTAETRKKLQAAGYLDWMLPRRRKLLPTLTRSKDGDKSEPIGQFQGVEVEYTGADGEWIPAGNWGVDILEKEAGVYINADDVPEELYDMGAEAKVRITATIETDFRITAIANRKQESPFVLPVIAQLELDSQFHWREITSLSKYASNSPGADSLDKDVGNAKRAVDDRMALQKYVDALRDRFDAIDVGGAVALEGVDQHGYQIGDRVAGIRGKNISYRATRKGDSFPQIIGITHDVTNQKTILQLQRFRETVVI